MKIISIVCKDCGESIQKFTKDPGSIELFQYIQDNHFCHRIKVKVNDLDKEIQLILFETRRFTTYVLNNYDCRDLVGVEIGTYLGENAKNILEVLKPKMLYLVDPYTNYEGYDNSDFNDMDINEVKSKAIDRLKDYNNKQLIFKKTEDCIDLIPDDLDFVYIDGNHKYEYVMKDLRLLYPKVKEGGIIGGHDFILGMNNDVCRAVLDFVDEMNIKKCFTKGPDFIIIKE